MRRLLPLLTPVVVVWAWWQAARVRRNGRLLSLAERELAAAVGVADAGRVRMCRVDRMPLPAARLLAALARRSGLPQPQRIDGMTIGHAIYLRDTGASSDLLLAHELRHVQQYETAGSIAAFLAQYLRQVAAHGYCDAPLEADARRAAQRVHAAQGRITPVARPEPRIASDACGPPLPSNKKLPTP